MGGATKTMSRRPEDDAFFGFGFGLDQTLGGAPPQDPMLGGEDFDVLQDFNAFDTSSSAIGAANGGTDPTFGLGANMSDVLPPQAFHHDPFFSTNPRYTTGITIRFSDDSFQLSPYNSRIHLDQQ